MSSLFTALFLLGGSIFVFIGSLGVARMPDVLCRAHALSKALTLGMVLMLIALWIAVGPKQADLKILLAILFLVTTIPIAGHLFALLAVKEDVPLQLDKSED